MNNMLFITCFKSWNNSLARASKTSLLQSVRRGLFLKDVFLAKSILILALFLSVPLIAKDEDQETLRVRLATDVQLLPLVISPITQEGKNFSEDYIRSLEKILRFDFDHNGFSYVSKATQNAYFIINPRIENGLLSAKVTLVNSNIVKSIEAIALTGDLSKDRKIVHRLSDIIHKAIFGSDGIASTQVLFTVKTQNPSTKKWTSEVYESDYDGGNLRRVTNGGHYCVTPSYIPPKAGYKAGSFVFVSYQIGQPKIYLGRLGSNKIERFSLLKGNQLMPTISRQKDKIAFISDVTGNPDLFIQDFDPEKGAVGKPRQIFATYRATQGTPSFSPDGKKIAFVSNKDGSARVYVIDVPAPGTALKDIKAKLISKINLDNTAPSWSPDGTKIAYCCRTKGVRQIWVYDFQSNQERQLTQGKGNKENPTWAPNSLHLIFNTSDTGSSELYLLNLNQKEATQISGGPGEKHFPSFEIRN